MMKQLLSGRIFQKEMLYPYQQNVNKQTEINKFVSVYYTITSFTWKKIWRYSSKYWSTCTPTQWMHLHLQRNTVDTLMMMKDIIQRAQVIVEFPAILEPLGPSNGKKADGMTLVRWSEGKALICCKLLSSCNWHHLPQYGKTLKGRNTKNWNAICFHFYGRSNAACLSGTILYLKSWLYDILLESIKHVPEILFEKPVSISKKHWLICRTAVEECHMCRIH